VRGNEIRAAGELAGRAFGTTTAPIRAMHEAIASRVFRPLGLLALPTRVLHDHIGGAVYGTLRTAFGAVPRSAGALLARAAPTDALPLTSTTRGGIALGALNGAVGDALARTGNELALPMTLRHGGGDLTLDESELAAVFPDAGPRLAVFVHGLCETDESWRLAPLGRSGPPSRSYGSRLKHELGYSPLYLRYNTGLHISDNGRRLSELLEQAVASWPVPVEEIVLVGHSMGGLVARSACYYGDALDDRWVDAVRHVFCLGTPHLGAPLEKAANVAGWALGRLPETRGLAQAVNGRSVGIKDLRFGSCVEEDWCDCDVDEFLKDRCREVPFLEHAAYYFVSATITREPDSMLGTALGDLLVRAGSASGRGRRRRLPFEVDRGRELGGLTHFDLLNHPLVYEQIREWLEARSALAG
jgi:pimeloyl-ACP methyl ester carboxylesterase